MAPEKANISLFPLMNPDLSLALTTTTVGDRIPTPGAKSIRVGNPAERCCHLAMGAAETMKSLIVYDDDWHWKKLRNKIG